jgi:hypothetical protein
MSLIEPKKPDNFEHESPIRAFTDFKVAGGYAIGKGFRPSLAHLSTYLDAMESKEHWQFVQIILPDDDDGAPTMLFRKSLPTMNVLTVEEAKDMGRDWKEIVKGYIANEAVPIREKTPADDPIHPKHYNGTECAEIGELLTANSFQVLRYNWRLGKKDDALQEIGKSLFYVDREIALGPLDHIPNRRMPVQSWFDERLEGCDEYVRAVAWRLIDWNRTGDKWHLDKLRLLIVSRKVAIENGSGLAL